MRRSFRVIVPAAAGLVAAAALVGPTTAASTAAPTMPKGEITVSAAASLTEAFTEIGAKFERKHEGTDVTFNFDASSALVLQIEGGAPADVLASADDATMDRLVDGGQVTTAPVTFAHNKLRITVKPGNPERVRGLADLADVGVVSLCAPEVPCGKYADAALAEARVTIPTDRITRGRNAKGALTAVSAGDAAAAIVYVTDVEAAGSSVRGVTIPDARNQIATYPIAPLADAPNGRTAKAFVRFVMSRAGQQILEQHGFLPA